MNCGWVSRFLRIQLRQEEPAKIRPKRPNKGHFLALKEKDVTHFYWPYFIHLTIQNTGNQPRRADLTEMNAVLVVG